MRVYIPTVPATLATLAAEGSLPGPLRAFAVTTELAQWVDESGGAEEPDDEEYEYAAMGEAARASLRLLAAASACAAGDATGPACRVVLAADVPDRSVSSVADGGPGEVHLDGALTRAQLVSVHVDDADAADAVAAAFVAVLAADDGNEAAEEVVGAADADELLWYAAAELPLLVAEPRFDR